MMLEDPKLVRTPRTSLTRRFCALFFFKGLTTILMLIDAVTAGNRLDDNRRKHR